MGQITKIYGKCYDLSEFKHPGGLTSIQLAYDRDASGLFTMHHPFVSKEKLQSILEKYEVKDFKSPELSDLNTIESDTTNFVYDTEFSRELISEVKRYFQQRSNGQSLTVTTKTTITKWVIIWLLSIFNIWSGYLWISGHLASLFLFPISAWLLSVHTFHDAYHFSLSNKPLINDVFGIIGSYFVSPEAWLYQHNIGHHANTNILNKDPDLHHGDYVSRMHPGIRFKPLYLIQRWTHFLLVWTSSFFGAAIRPTISRFSSGKYYPGMVNMKIGLREVMTNLCLTVLFIFRIAPIFMFQSIIKGVIFVLINFIVSSLVFMINTQLTHLSEDCINLPTPETKIDWYKHQVVSSCNFGTNRDTFLNTMHSIFVTFCSGALNYQIEHHLFPGVNQAHLPAISRIVKSVCIKHSVPYKSFEGYVDAFAHHYKYVLMLSNETDG